LALSPIPLADANCSNISTLLMGCFSNSNPYEQQISPDTDLRTEDLRTPGFLAASMRRVSLPVLTYGLVR
jgi:hypothetical protein